MPFAILRVKWMPNTEGLSRRMEARSEALAETKEQGPTHTAPGGGRMVHQRSLGASDAVWDALRDLYTSTHGHRWLQKAHWMESSNPCGSDPSDADLWYGITCDHHANSGDGETRVTGVFLASNNLQGSMPTTLGAMSHFLTEKLDLSHNSLTGYRADAVPLPCVPRASGR